MYSFRCGYCGVSETQVGAQLTFDHFRPLSKGGTDEISNLVYACHACNHYKSDYWQESDLLRLLHPLTDDLRQHIHELGDCHLHPVSKSGVIYIDQLQLNRPALIENRMERQRSFQTNRYLEEMTATLDAILNEIKKLI